MNGAVYLAELGLVLGIAYLVGCAVYSLLFHPLRRFPGPLFYRVSLLPRAWYHMNGTLPFRVSELHKRYGPVVRIGPDELAFCSPQAWRDIYGHKKGQSDLPKFPGFYRVFGDAPMSIFDATSERHAMLRRPLAQGFSDRSMHEQAPIIGGYVDLLVSRLRAAVQKSSRQDVRNWYNWTTFDLIGDLSFGVEGGFGCLERTDNHPWIQLIMSAVRQSAMMRALSRLGFKQAVIWVSKLSMSADNQHRAIVYQKVGQRLQGGKRSDFMEGLISHKEELGLTQELLTVNASVLIFAGSETTATALCGVTYFLTTHPEILKKLEQEVRSAFKSDDEITLTSVSKLSYMLACLDESLRCYPPVATGFPRQVPEGGVMIDGKFVPQGTVVSVFQWAVNHDEYFWTEPELFAPERWLGDPKYKDDQFGKRL
ncbi:putative cytochrome P450 monooxygenase [Xylaria intraflava]|nr:putative cytochrome P450 monooxygenase [Xylaria intraflava]